MNNSVLYQKERFGGNTENVLFKVNSRLDGSIDLQGYATASINK